MRKCRKAPTIKRKMELSINRLNKVIRIMEGQVVLHHEFLEAETAKFRALESEWQTLMHVIFTAYRKTGIEP